MQQIIQYIEINKIKPAEYNPRKINKEQFEELKKSIDKLGFIMPVIVNKKDNTIIAGHQRTRAAKELGIEKAPCIYVDDLSVGDEIKFNQLHNGTMGFNNDLGKCNIELEHGYSLVDNKEFIIEKTETAQASYIKEICKLILKYGNVFSAVIYSGKIIMGANYIRACQQLNLKVLCYNTNNPESKKYIQGDYGVFTYEHLKKNTYVQGLAQLHRNVEKREDLIKNNYSSLYSGMVLPYLNKAKDKKLFNILDFGCGKGAYINHLKKQGYNAIGVEFYNNNGSARNTTLGNKQIDELFRILRKGNKFNIVVCDSVLNSVDSVEAEKSVITCLNLFCELGGTLFISGRTIDSVERGMNAKVDSGVGLRYIQFLDADGFTGNYRKGNWYYQKFHTRKEIPVLMAKYDFEVLEYEYLKSSWHIMARKNKELDNETYKKAVDFEFNLPLPNKTYNRHEELKTILNLK